MSNLGSHPDGGNPFSTRYVRPGALPYLFLANESLSDVLQRLADNGWHGQIIGPHGSGKSTLLATLLPAIEALGRQVILVELHDGQRRLPVDATSRVRACTQRDSPIGRVPWPRSRSHDANSRIMSTQVKTCHPDVGRVATRQNNSTTPGHDPAYRSGAQVLVIDGYEQLPWWRRRWLQWRCRRRGIGLLVTAHRSVGLPDIFHIRIEPDIAQQVVSRLLENCPQVIEPDEVLACVDRHDQDFREALFELYDLFEQRRKE